jgi:cystathionine beta-lyase
LGVDLTIHALTKYPSGGGDVLMGSIVTRDNELARLLKLSHMRLGTGVGANDAEMVLRSLSSMPLRYKAQDSTARALAAWCTMQSAFSQVLHPALSSSPGHAHWQQLCVTPNEPDGLAAGIFSVVIDPRFPAHVVDAFCDNLKLFKIGYSWGGPMSLVMPFNMASSRSRTTQHMQRGRVVRFCIGLEQVKDLQADLSQALAFANLKI